MNRLIRTAQTCMHAYRCRLPVAVLSWTLLTMQCAAQVPLVPTPALVQQPRAYGYTVGDLLQQRIALGSIAAPFVPAELPRIGRIGSSLWRRRVAQQVDANGQHWLQLEYQLINTPQSLTVWYLPKLLLKSATGGNSITVANAAFSVSPFTPPQPFEETALPALQPVAAPAPVPLSSIMRRMRAAGAALLLVFATWAALLLWRYMRRGRLLPFACVVRDIRVLRKAAASDPLALHRHLHHAFNATAGEVVRLATLPNLLQRAPHLASEESAINDFLRRSHGAFFGGHAPADTAVIAALAQRLRRLEQRHAK